MKKEELTELAGYIDELGDKIPNGLSHLKDAVNFACIEIRMHARFRTETPDLSKAIEFAKSIPKVDDFDDPVITDWMLHNTDFLKYMP